MIRYQAIEGCTLQEQGTNAKQMHDGDQIQLTPTSSLTDRRSSSILSTPCSGALSSLPYTAQFEWCSVTRRGSPKGEENRTVQIRM